MDRWIKLVALFLLVFTVYDVSVPEPCLEQGLAIAANSTQAQASHEDGDQGSCQFEEDCLACAHVLPGTSYVMAVTQVVAAAESALLLPAQGGISVLPYHPPRA